MSKPIQIGASVACANFAALGADLRQLSASHVDFLHIDIMDGHFVDNFALDFSAMETVRRITDLPMDCHLMIEEPERYVGRAVTAGATYITIHFEATRQVQKVLQQIRHSGVRSGVALNPATPVECLEYILDDLDLVTVMTVNPGASGQKLIPAMLRKIADVRCALDRAGRGEVEVEVDGNVSFAHIPEMVRAGATMLVGGTSSVFHKDYSIPEAITAVRNLVENLGRVQ